MPLATNQQTSPWYLTPVPSALDAKAILTWTSVGSSDLDLHYVSSAGEVYFSNFIIAGIAYLDRDNVSGPSDGPETMTLYKTANDLLGLIYIENFSFIYYASGETSN